MTELKNARHERFATGLVDGLSQEKAYIEAGFSPNGARGAACNLLKHYSSIIKRRDELLAEREMLNTIARVRAMETTQIDKERVMRELMDNAMIAKQAVPVLDKNGNETGVYNVNISASNQALIALGKEIGMFHNKPVEAPRSKYADMSDEELKQYIFEKCRKLGFEITLPKRSTNTKLMRKRNNSNTKY